MNQSEQVKLPIKLKSQKIPIRLKPTYKKPLKMKLGYKIPIHKKKVVGIRQDEMRLVTSRSPPLVTHKIKLKRKNLWNVFLHINKKALKGLDPSIKSNIYHFLLPHAKNAYGYESILTIQPHKTIDGVDYVLDDILQKYRPYRQKFHDIVTDNIDTTDQGSTVDLSNTVDDSGIYYGLNYSTLMAEFADFVKSDNQTLTFDGSIQSGLAFDLISKLIDLALLQKGYSLTLDDKSYYYINKQTGETLKKRLRLGNITIQEEHTSIGIIYFAIKRGTSQFVKIIKPTVMKPKYALSG